MYDDGSNFGDLSMFMGTGDSGDGVDEGNDRGPLQVSVDSGSLFGINNQSSMMWCVGNQQGMQGLQQGTQEVSYQPLVFQQQQQNQQIWQQQQLQLVNATQQSHAGSSADASAQGLHMGQMATMVGNPNNFGQQQTRDWAVSQQSQQMEGGQQQISQQQQRQQHQQLLLQQQQQQQNQHQNHQQQQTGLALSQQQQEQHRHQQLLYQQARRQQQLLLQEQQTRLLSGKGASAHGGGVGGASDTPDSTQSGRNSGMASPAQQTTPASSPSGVLTPQQQQQLRLLQQQRRMQLQQQQLQQQMARGRGSSVSPQQQQQQQQQQAKMQMHARSEQDRTSEQLANFLNNNFESPQISVSSQANSTSNKPQGRTIAVNDGGGFSIGMGDLEEMLLDTPRAQRGSTQQYQMFRQANEVGIMQAQQGDNQQPEFTINMGMMNTMSDMSSGSRGQPQGQSMVSTSDLKNSLSQQQMSQNRMQLQQQLKQRQQASQGRASMQFKGLTPQQQHMLLMRQAQINAQQQSSASQNAPAAHLQMHSQQQSKQQLHAVATSGSAGGMNNAALSYNQPTFPQVDLEALLEEPDSPWASRANSGATAGMSGGSDPFAMSHAAKLKAQQQGLQGSMQNSVSVNFNNLTLQQKQQLLLRRQRQQQLLLQRQQMQMMQASAMRQSSSPLGANPQAQDASRPNSTTSNVSNASGGSQQGAQHNSQIQMHAAAHASQISPPSRMQMVGQQASHGQGVVGGVAPTAQAAAQQQQKQHPRGTMVEPSPLPISACDSPRPLMNHDDLIAELFGGLGAPAYTSAPPLLSGTTGVGSARGLETDAKFAAQKAGNAAGSQATSTAALMAELKHSQQAQMQLLSGGYPAGNSSDPARVARALEGNPQLRQRLLLHQQLMRQCAARLQSPAGGEPSASLTSSDPGGDAGGAPTHGDAKSEPAADPGGAQNAPKGGGPTKAPVAKKQARKQAAKTGKQAAKRGRKKGVEGEPDAVPEEHAPPAPHPDPAGASAGAVVSPGGAVVRAEETARPSPVPEPVLPAEAPAATPHTTPPPGSAASPTPQPSTLPQTQTDRDAETKVEGRDVKEPQQSSPQLAAFESAADQEVVPLAGPDPLFAEGDDPFAFPDDDEPKAKKCKPSSPASLVEPKCSTPDVPPQQTTPSLVSEAHVDQVPAADAATERGALASTGSCGPVETDSSMPHTHGTQTGELVKEAGAEHVYIAPIPSYHDRTSTVDKGEASVSHIATDDKVSLPCSKSTDGTNLTHVDQDHKSRTQVIDSATVGTGQKGDDLGKDVLLTKNSVPSYLGSILSSDAVALSEQTADDEKGPEEAAWRIASTFW